MAAERLSVRKIREVLRLSAKGLTHRQISRSLSISHNTAASYLRRAAAAGVDAEAAESLDDVALIVSTPDKKWTDTTVQNWTLSSHVCLRCRHSTSLVRLWARV